MILEFIKDLREEAVRLEVPVEISGPEVAPQVQGFVTRPLAVVRRNRGVKDSFGAVPTAQGSASNRNALRKSVGLKIEITARSTQVGARPEHHWDAVDDIAGAIACAVERVRKKKGWLLDSMTGGYEDPPANSTAEQGAKYVLAIQLAHGVREKTWTTVDAATVTSKQTTKIKTNDADAGETACGG